MLRCATPSPATAQAAEPGSGASRRVGERRGTRWWIAFALVTLGGPGAWGEWAWASPSPSSAWRLVILGVVQDAGMPHLGCNESPCREARAGELPREKVSSIGIVNKSTGKAYLFDATPDFPAQVHALTGGRVPDGIFLTHAHIGHYTGLMYLGKEGTGAHDARVFCTARMARYLTENGPWSRLVADGNIALKEVQVDQPMELEVGLTVSALKVPHREEFSDTVGYRIQGPRATAVFIPDIDSWERWDRSLRRLADEVDILLVDGTFSGTDQVKGRSFDEIPHPLMPHTRELLRGTRAQLWFIHLNHNNPLLNKADDVVKEGMEFGL